MQRYKVTVKANSGISGAMRKYCNDYGISIWSFLSSTVTERLQKPLDFSIAEIEEMQKRPHDKNAEFEVFYFGISDAIIQEKLILIKDDFGISLNRFFLYIIAEKLTNCGYSFDDKSLKNPVRKNAIMQKQKNHTEPYAESVEELRKSWMEISMRKK